jgi:release factor glutamine methyltransferase
LSESDLLFVRSCINRLLKNEPFQYIVGETEFYGLRFQCNPNALIPRPETEELVADILNTLAHVDCPKIADLCTGSGCIGITLAKKISGADIVLTDISAEAVGLAQSNARLNEVELEYVIEDLFFESAFQGWETNSFDCWVSNPPYIPLKEKSEMEENVLGFEPHIALFVEDSDPIIFYREIITQAKHYLKQNGWLFFEIHPDFSTEIVCYFEKKGFVNIELMKDLQGRIRMLKGQNA